MWPLSFYFFVALSVSKGGTYFKDYKQIGQSLKTKPFAD